MQASPVLLLLLTLLHLPPQTPLSAPLVPPNTNSCDPHYEHRNATTGCCDCREGFHGLNCRMCTPSSSSSSLLPDSCQASFGPDFSCVTGLVYDAHASLKTYDCVLASNLQALVPDGALAVQCHRNEHLVANCSAAVYSAKASEVQSEHVIDCHLTQCTFETGAASGACKEIRCKCGPQCSAMTRAIVEHVLSGKRAAIDVTNGTHLAIDVEGSPIPLAATCEASACERGSSASGSSSGSGSASGGTNGWRHWSWTVLAAALMVVGLLGVLWLSSCWKYTGLDCRTTRKRQKEVEKGLGGYHFVRTLEFRHISCSADSGRQLSGACKPILHEISGNVSHGQVLGLLGPSGSGKTTLLNALAVVDNGQCQVTGDLLLDGKQVSSSYRRIAAYVQQDDSLYSTLTVRECISYSSQLRLSAMLLEEVKNARVDRVIAELNLGHVAHSRIGSVGGSSGRRGVSGGERRRVSIGMELVTSPQILILDEPTSGLDSSSAHSVVQLLKDLASRGRIVILSIHQPSARSFVLLDKILLLGKGKVLYSGAPAKSKCYFEDLGYKCPEHENIADFILDIASDTRNIPMIRSHMKQNEVPPRQRGIVPRHTSSSPTSKMETLLLLEEELLLDTPRIENIVSLPLRSETPDESSTFGMPATSGMSCSPPPVFIATAKTDAIDHDMEAPPRSIVVEVRVLFVRTTQNILRDRSLLVLHIALSLSLALFGGLIFNHVTNDLAGFQNRMGAFYFILTFFGFASMSSMDLFIGERSIFLRETSAMYYGPFSYFLAKATLDTLLLRILPALIFASIFYGMMGLQASMTRFLMFSLTLVLFNVAAGAICLLVGVLSRRVGPANLGATVVLLVMLLFGGFLLNSQTMPTSVGWMKHLSIFSYAFEILMTNELKGLILEFDAPGYPAVPIYGEVYLKTLGMDYANQYYDVAALALIAVSLQVLAFLFLSLQVPLPRDIADQHMDNDTPLSCKQKV
uniref:ABC transporter domain-containing protein n=1 Tax=Hyaloperonospora arabidopsidis (strain Emoy2) TaxID=559515 RepID=M4BQM0_HYAAE